MSSIEPEKLIGRMVRFPTVLRATCAVVDREDALWKPDPDSWSILEVVCHLCDEEVDDFRDRLQRTLKDPSGPWVPFDPQEVARNGDYQSQNLVERLDSFAWARTESIAWLEQALANNPNWSFAHEHPNFGPIRAGDLLASWAAHDALHLRQISKRIWQLANRDAGDHPTRYAGDW